MGNYVGLLEQVIPSDLKLRQKNGGSKTLPTSAKILLCFFLAESAFSDCNSVAGLLDRMSFFLWPLLCA